MNTFFSLLAALVGKDLTLFFSNRREMILSFVVPIALASFMGLIFAPRSSDDGEGSTIIGVEVRWVDLDQTDLSEAIFEALKSDSSLNVVASLESKARNDVARGTAAVLIIIPEQFSEQAVGAFFGGAAPDLILGYDPSRTIERDLVRGLLSQHVISLVSQDAIGNPTRSVPQIRQLRAGLEDPNDDTLTPEQRLALGSVLDGLLGLLEPDQVEGAEPIESTDSQLESQIEPSPTQPLGGFNVPFNATIQAIRARQSQDENRPSYNSYSHYFAGMGVQYIFFSAIDSAILLMEERRRGIWKRIRTAAIGRSTLLLSKAISSALVALLILAVTMAFGMAVFGIRIEGSLLGFTLMMTTTAMVSSGFCLLLAAVGGTPRSTRLMATFIVLVLAMLGGAWFPSFFFPSWLKDLTLAMPTTWAIQGFEAMTWRGLEGQEAIVPALALLSFTLVFSLIAVWRFRWEES